MSCPILSLCCSHRWNALMLIPPKTGMPTTITKKMRREVSKSLSLIERLLLLMRDLRRAPRRSTAEGFDLGSGLRSAIRNDLFENPDPLLELHRSRGILRRFLGRHAGFDLELLFA